MRKDVRDQQWITLDISPRRSGDEEDVEVIGIDEEFNCRKITYNFDGPLQGFLWGGFHVNIIGWMPLPKISSPTNKI